MIRRDENLPVHRELCLRCRRAKRVCQCADVRPFEPEPIFVILMHPIERRKKTGTGRMTHLCLSNSIFIEGTGFAEHALVNELIADPRYYPVVLYPGASSLDLGELKTPESRRLLIFVVDSTWNLAKTMLKRSPNLRALPQIRFTPKKLSTYRIRRQPDPICLSTIEAVHHMLETLHPGRPEHANLLHAFDRMVERQIDFGRSRRHNKA